MHTEINKIPEKLRRKSIALDDKIRILDKLKSGAKVATIAKELNLQESTVRTIRQNESKIQAILSSTSLLDLKKVAQIKDMLVPKIKKCLMIWIKDCYSRNIPVNSVAIKQKALKVYQRLKDSESISSNELHKPKFKASTGWFHRFKMRFSLRNMRIVGESASANTEVAQRFSEIVKEDNYIVEQVYNIDEFALYWKKCLVGHMLHKMRLLLQVSRHQKTE
ncbi:tigger transposable element-derived protein 1-like [Centruroides vittatus]|uniref:tigger transposable element-derived protein 1-like n=1 Tax=Centruroides vittatus TaxID=120091 RepID=UPI00350FD170